MERWVLRIYYHSIRNSSLEHDKRLVVPQQELPSKQNMTGQKYEKLILVLWATYTFHQNGARKETEVLKFNYCIRKSFCSNMYQIGC